MHPLVDSVDLFYDSHFYDAFRLQTTEETNQYLSTLKKKKVCALFFTETITVPLFLQRAPASLIMQLHVS